MGTTAGLSNWCMCMKDIRKEPEKAEGKKKEEERISSAKGDDKLGNKEPEEKRKICRGAPGPYKPPDRDEGILPGRNKQDMRMRQKNGERGKPAHMEPKVKLHYLISILSLRNSFICDKINPHFPDYSIRVILANLPVNPEF